jgi:hypothetical protein
MKVISAYTPNLADKIKPLERSLKGFDYQLIEHKPEEIESFRTDWPENRPFYCTAQGGEFMKWVDYEGIICLIDADVIAQRKPTREEYKAFLPEKGEFTACQHAYPAVKLFESSIYKPCGLEKEDFIEIGAALLIAHSSDWRRLREYYLHYFDLVTSVIKHHAATQWLISYIIQKHFKLKLGSELLHNASWYKATRTETVNGKLLIDNIPVIFNHHKFNL